MITLSGVLLLAIGFALGVVATIVWLVVFGKDEENATD